MLQIGDAAELLRGGVGYPIELQLIQLLGWLFKVLFLGEQQIGDAADLLRTVRLYIIFGAQQIGDAADLLQTDFNLINLV